MNIDKARIIEVIEGLLPYAEQEVAAIEDVARKDNDEAAQDEADEGNEILLEARALLNELKG